MTICVACLLVHKKLIINKLVNRNNSCCRFGVSLATLGEEIFNGIPTAADNLQRRTVNRVLIKVYAGDFL